MGQVAFSGKGNNRRAQSEKTEESEARSQKSGGIEHRAKGIETD